MNIKSLALTLGLGWLTVSAQADLTVVQEAYYGDLPQRVTVKIKGNKMRVDGVPMGYMIMDATSGDTFVVLAQQKSYLKVGNAPLAEAVEAKVGEDAASAQFKPTGETARVDDYDTEIYTTETDRVKAKYWVAKNYPDYATIRDDYHKMTNGFMANFLKSKMPATDNLPGMPVKTEVSISEPAPVVIYTKLLSVSRDPLGDDIFVIPGDYRLLEMPVQQLMQ
ncbi:MAG: DUF4412 domain-containing protein [Verrucomicrobiales bacterium]|nr:DUF4412 domain-containing protein [Verrucomicrobiales bacterium]